MLLKKILVIGGAGYIGSALVNELSREFDVSVFDKKYGDDLLDKKCLASVKGFDFVVNLASVVRSFNKSKYEDNAEGLRNLIDFIGDGKLIYFSSFNVNLRDKGPYAKSKIWCEKILMKSKVDWAIVRPNYVYSISRRGDFYKMAVLAKRFGFVPVIGKGRNKIKPILREELCKILAEIIKNFKSRKIIEISGREKVSFNEIADIIGEVLNKRVRKIHFSFRLVKLFKFALPFDVEGINEDKISAGGFVGKSSFRNDLRRIVELVK